MTLYFVGAGLTKSLQRQRRVPLMMDFTNVLTEGIANDVILNTLVVMELGEVYEQPCTDCRKLAERIGRNVPQASIADREQFAQLVRARQPESIEMLFERAENRGSSANIYASDLHAYFRHGINQVFASIGWDLELPILERFLRAKFEHDGNGHVFVSFNYDLVLDKCIESASDNQWQPRNGYGFEFPFYTTIDPESEHPGSAAQGRSSVELPIGTDRIKLIKPHGSLNWLVPQNNSGAADPGEMLIPLSPDMKIRYWPSSQTFNYTQRPGEWPRDVKILIAPPSPQKPEVLRRAASDEFDALRVAEDVFVLGYSFPKTDRDQMELLRTAVSARKAPIDSVTVVNFRASATYFDDIESLLKPQRMQRFNDGFADFVSKGS
jgi:hypothetical protein